MFRQAQRDPKAETKTGSEGLVNFRHATLSEEYESKDGVLA